MNHARASGDNPAINAPEAATATMGMREKMARAMLTRTLRHLKVDAVSQDGMILYTAAGPIDLACCACDALDALMRPTEGMSKAAAKVIIANQGKVSSAKLAEMCVFAMLSAAREGK